MPDELKPCRMCLNARVDDELTDSCDLSYITIGDCGKGFRIMIASGDGKPVRILFEHRFGDGIWHLVGIYYPSYCPNCGRKLSEYDVDAWNRRVGEGG